MHGRSADATTEASQSRQARPLPGRNRGAGRTLAWWLLLPFALCLGTAALAQTRDDGFKVTELQPAPLEAPKVGKLALAEGTLAGNEQHFTLSNLSIFQPVAVVVIAEDPTHPVTLRLGKFDWKEDFKGGKTGSDGRVVAAFRTQGDLLVTVGAPDAAAYTLAVWVGEEAPPPMKPLLVPAGDADGGGWREHKLLLAIAGGLLILALGWFAGRRNRRNDK